MAAAGASTTTESSSPFPKHMFKSRRRPPPPPGTQVHAQTISDHHPDPNAPNPPPPHLPSIIQSTKCKSSISALLLSTFTNTYQTRGAAANGEDIEKKRGLRGSTLRGFGCTAHPDVLVPEAVIRSSADWEDQIQRDKNKERKNKNKNKKSKKNHKDALQLSSSTGVQDVCCGPGIGIAGFGSAADDCVVSTRPLSGRGKIDVDKVLHRERSSYSSRQRVNPDYFAPLDLDSVFDVPRFGSDVLEDRYCHHFRNRSDEELAEIMLFGNGLLGRRSGGPDRFQGWRLDVDHMSYEELLALGDRIGYVSTGLMEDEIHRYIRKAKLCSSNDLSSSSSLRMDRKCCICQEEYETEDELGKLDCGHIYHMQCIEQWLGQKNACPVCKSTVASR